MVQEAVVTVVGEVVVAEAGVEVEVAVVEVVGASLIRTRRQRNRVEISTATMHNPSSTLTRT